MTPRNWVLAGSLAGVLFGLGLGLASNVSGAVLAFYGLGAGAIVAAVAAALRRG